MWFKQRMGNQGSVNNSQLGMPVSHRTCPQGFGSFHHLPLEHASLLRKAILTLMVRNSLTTNLEVSVSTHRKVLKRSESVTTPSLLFLHLFPLLIGKELGYDHQNKRVRHN